MSGGKLSPAQVEKVAALLGTVDPSTAEQVTPEVLSKVAEAVLARVGERTEAGEPAEDAVTDDEIDALAVVGRSLTSDDLDEIIELATTFAYSPRGHQKALRKAYGSMIPGSPHRQNVRDAERREAERLAQEHCERLERAGEDDQAER